MTNRKTQKLMINYDDRVSNASHMHKTFDDNNRIVSRKGNNHEKLSPKGMFDKLIILLK